MPDGQTAPHYAVAAPVSWTPVGQPPLPPHLLGHDVRRMSPRRMASLSFELYMEGLLRAGEYALLAFQPELQRDFGRTIGALIGRGAEPDSPQDHLAIWRQRVGFERRHPGGSRAHLSSMRRVLHLLERLDAARAVSA